MPTQEIEATLLIQRKLRNLEKHYNDNAGWKVLTEFFMFREGKNGLLFIVEINIVKN